jgi:hypothetical protein
MMRWNYLLVEIYCFDPTCDRSYIDHLEYRQGSWCEGHLGGFLATLGLWRIVRELCSAWWEEFSQDLRWHLWDRWFWDGEEFAEWLDEHTLEEGEYPEIDEWFKRENWRCEFPEKEERDELG